MKRIQGLHCNNIYKNYGKDLGAEVGGPWWREGGYNIVITSEGIVKGSSAESMQITSPLALPRA